MLSCKSNNIDGITYFSKQVSEETFVVIVGVNLVLFATYQDDKKISEICNHLEIDDSFNFAMFIVIAKLKILLTFL